MMKVFGILALCVFALMIGAWAVLNIFAPRTVATPQKVSIKLNLPPQPPNCPDYPELANLKLKDGSIADVRIIQDGDQKFYIPFSWYTAPLKWSQVNGSTKVSDYLAIFAGKWNPDMAEIECPGVLHIGPFNYTTPDAILRDPRYDHSTIPNFSPESKFNYVNFYKFDTSLPGVKMIENDDIEAHSIENIATIKLDQNHWAECQDFPTRKFLKTEIEKQTGDEVDCKRRIMASDEFQNWRQSVHGLYDWLKTPPRDRDNDRIFILGVK
jgi:hypothetical protein